MQILTLLMLVCVCMLFSQNYAYSEPSVKTVKIPMGSGIGPEGGCHVKNECFVPQGLVIEKGTTVTWINEDEKNHTVVSGKPENDRLDGIFNSGVIEPGKDFSFTFETAAIYPYFCTIHPWMEGMITVKSGPEDSEVLEKLDQGTNVTIVIGVIGIGAGVFTAYYFWNKKK